MKRFSKKTIIIILSFLVFLVVIICTTSNSELVASLDRPGYGEASYSEVLKVENESGQSVEVEITVPPKSLSGEMLENAFEETFDEICKLLPGDNENLSSVQSDLVLEDYPGQYGIRADYSLKDYAVIDSYGAVHNETLTEPYECELYITLMYERLSREYVLTVIVLPAEQGQEEYMKSQVLKQITDETDTSDQLKLPTEIDNQRIRFYRETGLQGSLLLCAILFAGVLFYYLKRVVPRKERERREELLRLDYAEVVSKLSLLTGAGMSIRNAFLRIGSDYKTKLSTVAKKTANAKRPAYEEICVMLRRLEAGVSEEQAYHEYGKACKLREYLKLSTLLTQGLRKGNKRLLEELKEEAEAAFSERKIMAIREGEKASTKLVFPMIMMLGIVFIIIIVPAFMSM